MRYVFFGTPEFAAIILETLIKAGFIPAAVVCNPDRPVGRKKVITAPPVKVVAEKHGIKVWQPEKLETESWKSEINKLGGVDFAVVAAYAKIIPKAILDTLPAKFIGAHPSLLPKHRGATPIQTAILNGDKKIGITLYLLDDKVDHGPIIAQRELNYELGIMHYKEAVKKLADLSAELLIETLPKFLAGEITPAPQNETEATYTKKFTAEDAFVDLEKDAPETIERKIRALNPEPGVWTYINGKRTKLLDAEIQDKKLRLKIIQAGGKMPKQL